MLEIPAVLSGCRAPYKVMVQLPGTAVRVKAGALRSEFERGGGLREALMKHALGLPTQVTQSAACGRIVILDAQRLKAAWCECHDLIRRELDDLLAA